MCSLYTLKEHCQSVKNNRRQKKNVQKETTSKNSNATLNLSPFASSPFEKATDDFLINFVIVITSQIQKITTEKIITKGGKKLSTI